VGAGQIGQQPAQNNSIKLTCGLLVKLTGYRNLKISSSKVGADGTLVKLKDVGGAELEQKSTVRFCDLEAMRV